MDERQREILKSLVQMAHADAKVTEPERMMLDRVADLLGCGPEELACLSEEESRLEEVMIDREDRRDAVRSLLAMSMSDDVFALSEHDYLGSIVDRLGITSEELKQLRTEAAELIARERTGESGRVHLG